MKAGLDITRLIAQIAFILVMVLLLGFMIDLTRSASEPSAYGVSRLVDTQYNVLCYYGRLWGSCVLLKP